MPYHGPGFYRHYKGGLYEVMGLGLKEDTVAKADAPDAGPEVTCVVYRPLTEGSYLEGRDESFWLRELVDFNKLIQTDRGAAPRFARESCPGCQETKKLRPIGAGRLVCENCGENW